jgi:hypothetical protein
MGLRAPKQVPRTTAEFDRWARDVEVAPDDGTVGTSKLADAAVTDPKLASNAATNRVLRDSAANSVVGRSAATPGDPADIAIANNQFLGTRSNVTGSFALVDADIPPTIARDTEITAAIAAHVAALDPHTQYLTAAEGNAAYQPLSAALAQIYRGTGSPEGVVTATRGAMFQRTDGGAGTCFYVKESDTTNTGWVAK